MTRTEPINAAASRGRRPTAALGLLLATLVLAACKGCAPGGENGGMELIDRPALDRLVEAQSGRVVLVDFWATWCRPCVELFPHTVELSRRYADRGLSVLTVSLDDPRNGEAVRRFLADREATTTENFLARNGASSQTVSEFEIKGGGIPFLKIYDRRGRLRTTISGAYPDKIDRAVEKLLNET
jgi:thiol-disulfide isomerase/thioredoxin